MAHSIQHFVIMFARYLRQVSVDLSSFLHQWKWPLPYNWNIDEIGEKRKFLKWQCLRFVRFFKSEFFSQAWTDVIKNSSKTAKNTEKRYSRNISWKACSEAICVWAALIQVNQDNSASVWWTAHARNRFVDENVFCRKI